MNTTFTIKNHKIQINKDLKKNKKPSYHFGQHFHTLMQRLTIVGRLGKGERDPPGKSTTGIVPKVPGEGRHSSPQGMDRKVWVPQAGTP